MKFQLVTFGMWSLASSTSVSLRRLTFLWRAPVQSCSWTRKYLKFLLTNIHSSSLGYNSWWDHFISSDCWVEIESGRIHFGSRLCDCPKEKLSESQLIFLQWQPAEFEMVVAPSVWVPETEWNREQSLSCPTTDMVNDEQEICFCSFKPLGIVWYCSITQALLNYSQDLNLITEVLPAGLRKVIQY